MIRPALRREAPIELVELQRLRLAIEASGDIVFTTDANGLFTYVNPQFERAYGYRAPDVVGRATPRILKSGTSTAAEYAAFWSQLTSNTVVKREFVNRRRDGALLPIETSANPIVDGAGRVIGFLAVQRDITMRRQMEAALHESERRYRTLADTAPDAIFIVNRDRLIEYANEFAAERFGLLTGQIVGKRVDEVFSRETAQLMWQQLSTVLTTGQKQFFEDRFDGPAGELWFDTWLVPMRDEAGNVRAVMGVARDVAARKVLERQFLQAQKMEVVGRLAGGIAHDFNNLLTAILGYTELLQERLADAPDALADLSEITKAGERASRLTRQLLAFSRKQTMAPELVDVNGLVADLSKMLARTLGEDIELSVVAGAGVAPIVADPGHLEQVLLNLAVNARDAMPKGGKLTIATANIDIDEATARRHVGSKPGSYVSLTVRDTGCGIPQDVLAHVFEPFFTTKPQGTGLGLATVYGIATQHGGHVTIDSRPDAGTTVIVYWPRGETAIRSADQTPEASHARGGAETILLVEDERPLRLLMRRTLERYGYNILEAVDVFDALNLAGTFEGPIKLLLSDVVMPGLNGPDLAQRIVARRRDIKVLYVSGFPNSLLPERAQKRDFMAFLPKPFTPNTLAQKVRECLDA